MRISGAHRRPPTIRDTLGHAFLSTTDLLPQFGADGRIESLLENSNSSRAQQVPAGGDHYSKSNAIFAVRRGVWLFHSFVVTGQRTRERANCELIPIQAFLNYLAPAARS
jgi:hypothetical protein